MFFTVIEDNDLTYDQPSVFTNNVEQKSLADVCRKKIPRRQFSGNNLISKNFKKLSLLESIKTQFYSVQTRTLVNSVTSFFIRVFFLNNCSLNFRKYPKNGVYWSSLLMHLYSYILKATTNLKSALQIFSWKCSKSKGFSKFQKFQNKRLENWPFLFNLTGLLFRIFNKSRAQEKCFL